MTEYGNEPRRAFQSLQMGRGVAALAVVLYHANGSLGSPKYLGIEPAAIFRGGNSGVDYFFVLSGAVMVLAHRRQLRGGGSVRDFVWKRFRRIYPPLWAALAIVLCSLLLIPGLAPAGLPTPQSIVGAFLVTPASIEPLLTVEWTLRHELMFYCLFAVALARPKAGAAALGVWFFASLVTAPFELSFPVGYLFAPIHLLFLMGIGSVFIHEKWHTRHPVLLFIAGSAGFAFTWKASLSGADGALLHWLYGFCAATMLVSSLELENCGRLPKMTILLRLGEASYSIYLTHFLTISVLAKLVFRLSHVFSLPPLIWFILTVGVATLTGFGFYWACEKPLLRLTAS